MLGLLDRVLAQIPALDLERSIVVVDRRRIRRRALPIIEQRASLPRGGMSEGRRSRLGVHLSSRLILVMTVQVCKMGGRRYERRGRAERRQIVGRLRWKSLK